LNQTFLFHGGEVIKLEKVIKVGGLDVVYGSIRKDYSYHACIDKQGIVLTYDILIVLEEV